MRFACAALDVGHPIKFNTFDAEYYHVNILTELLPLRPQIDRRRLVIHADNARPHTARKC
jgi:hypothetical protein